MIGRPPVSETIRFMAKVCKTKTCWLWTGSICRGYGQFKRGKPGRWKMISTHRFAYILFTSAIPRGKHICHRCDVRNCVNPKHLFVGTALDNQRDKWRKGRGTPMRAEKNGMFGKRPWNKGKRWSKEIRNKISRGRKAYYENAR